MNPDSFSHTPIKVEVFDRSLTVGLGWSTLQLYFKRICSPCHRCMGVWLRSGSPSVVPIPSRDGNITGSASIRRKEGNIVPQKLQDWRRHKTSPVVIREILMAKQVGGCVRKYRRISSPESAASGRSSPSESE